MRVAPRDILTQMPVPAEPSESVRPSSSSVLPKDTSKIRVSPPPEISPSLDRLITLADAPGLVAICDVASIVFPPISKHS